MIYPCIIFYSYKIKLISMGIYTGHGYKYGAQWEQIIYVKSPKF